MSICPVLAVPSQILAVQVKSSSTWPEEPTIVLEQLTHLGGISAQHVYFTCLDSRFLFAALAIYHSVRQKKH